MDDAKITGLIYGRDERGLSALKSKYNRLIMKICRGILRSEEDVEECAADTVIDVWDSIPPANPDNLMAYICRIARRKAINRLRYNTAAMRNSDLLTELDECVPYDYTPESASEEAELSKEIGNWLQTQSQRMRRLFILRYFYMDSVKDAARTCSMTENTASAALMRMRKSLKNYLIERGMFYE